MFLCIVQNAWGRGVTIDAAKKNAKRAGGSLKRYIIFKSTDPKVHVDGMGMIVSAAGAPAPVEVMRYPKSLK